MVLPCPRGELEIKLAPNSVTLIEQSSLKTDDATSVAMVHRLRLNQLEAPLNFPPNVMPTFGWALLAPHRGAEQVGYTLSARRVDKPGPNVSVSVQSEASINVILPELKLGEDQDWVWSVKLQLADGFNTSVAAARFSTGILDWRNATWIRRGINDRLAGAATDLFRAKLRIPFAPVRCRLFVVTPGFVQIQMNGKPVSSAVLGHKTMSRQRVLFDAHECQATSGDNFVGLVLSGGWARQLKQSNRTVMAVVCVRGAEPSQSIRLTTAADGTWQTAAGPIVATDMYQGEVYDGRLAAVREGWSVWQDKLGGWSSAQAERVPPAGRLVPSLAPPVRRVSSFPARVISQPRVGVFVVDFAQNLAGWVRLRIAGNSARGKNVTLTFSEELSVDGTVALLYNNVGPAIYTLLGNGRDETYEPSTTYWGFQYVQLEGLPAALQPSDIVSLFVHTDLSPVGNAVFGGGEASNVLNRVLAATQASQLSNWNDIHTDCPTREKHGWLGDTQIAAETDLYTFDSFASHSKFLGDMRDAQVDNNLTGLLPDVAPDGTGLGDPMQTSAYVLLVDWLHQHYSASALLEDHYDGLAEYVAGLARYINSTTRIIPSKPLSKWGDWCPAGRGPQCPAGSGMINSFYYVLVNDCMGRLAEALNKTDDSSRYRSNAMMMKAALHAQYWNGTQYVGEPHCWDNPQYACGLPAMTAMALPLYLNATPPALVQRAVDTLRSQFAASGGHAMGGIVGTKYLQLVLSEYGAHDLAMAAATKTTEPSLGYWVVGQGATTLWEMWPSSRNSSIGSKNHVMFGSHGSWYYSHVAGLTPLLPGWQRARVRPHVTNLTGGITSVSIVHDTVVGQFAVSWRSGPPVEALTCATPTEEGWNLTFSCPIEGAAIEAVLMASFGVVTGQCGAYDDSFCHANNSHAIATVAALCVGRHNCSVPVSPSHFGDACPAFTKLLSVQFQCEEPVPSPLFELEVTLAGASGGQIDVPLPSELSFDEVSILEGGTTVWKAGTFAAGQDGILAGSKLDVLESRGFEPREMGAGRYVSFDAVRGSYRFTVLALSSTHTTPRSPV